MPRNKRPAFVQSNFDREDGDHYPTCDHRAVDAFMYHFPKADYIVDVCANQGSAIVDYLSTCNVHAIGIGDAMCSDEDFPRKTGAILTNTPYTRPLVDNIIWKQIDRVANYRVPMAAFLLRSTFDHAASRRRMFEHPLYWGQIKICARLWWSESREMSPIHNYSWFIFSNKRPARPCVEYYYPPYDIRYAADNLHFKCRACGSTVKRDGKTGGRILRTSQQRVEACTHCGDSPYAIKVIENWGGGKLRDTVTVEVG